MACSACAPRYCAANRCYCGHPECDAASTYVKSTTVKVNPPRVDMSIIGTVPEVVVGKVAS